MVVERLFKEQMLKQKPVFALCAGVFFTLVGFITSYLLFRPFVGLATILFTVILALPSLVRLFEMEEEEQKKEASFLTRNEYLIDFYLYFFIGSFLVFFLIGVYGQQTKQSLVFSLEDLQQLSVPRGRATDAWELPPPPIQSREIYSIFSNNFYVMIISFVLSLFYGAGSLFLITFNGSIFAAALARVITLKIPHDPSWYTYTFPLFGEIIKFSPQGFWFTYTFMACNMGIMFFHGIPEVLAYFFAAIAGGALSEAVVKEKFFSSDFFKIIRNACLLLILSIIILYVAAVIEINVSKMLFTKDVCIKNKWFVNSILLTVVAGIIAFEIARKWIWKKIPSSYASLSASISLVENKQLIDYITHALQKGFSSAAIKKKLQETGHADHIIEHHLKKAREKL